MAKKSSLQLGIIALSAALLLGTVLFTLSFASQFSSASLFEANLTGIDSVAVPMTYETRINKGDSLFAAGYFSLAVTEYAFAIDIQDENPEAHAKLGLSYLELSEYENAVSQLKRAVDLSANSNTYLTDYGHTLIRNREFEKAKNTFDTLGDENQEGQFFSALLSAYFSDHDEAQKKLDKASDLSGPIAPAHIQYFKSAYANFNSQKEGQEIYLEALLAQSLIEIEEYELSEEFSLRVLNEKNDYRDVWVLLGYAKLKTQQYEEAEEAFKQAKKLDSVKPETHYFLGTSHYFQEEYENAVDAFELALLYGFEPEAEAYRKIAESQLFLENYEDSLAAYEYLIKIDPGNSEIFIRPIWISIEILSDLDRALTLAQESVSAFPSDAMSHNLLAWVYIQRNELKQAETEINTAFDIDPSLAEAHYNAGLLREKQGNIDSAKWEFKKAHELSKSGDSISAMAAEKYNSLVINQDSE